MNKWAGRFMARASEVATWSKDPSTQVGAVIAEGKRPISEGFNGPPECWDDSQELSREFRLAVTIHAEENAIMSAARSLQGTTMYVTHHPCARCAAKIAQVGITLVVCKPGADEQFSERWANEISLAETIFRQASIAFVEYKEADVDSEGLLQRD